jgi:hypothetical protein
LAAICFAVAIARGLDVLFGHDRRRGAGAIARSNSLFEVLLEKASSGLSVVAHLIDLPQMVQFG